MREWYYAKKGEQHGPVSEAKLLDLLRSGKVVEDDLVWTDGMKQWKPVRSMQNLFSTVPGNSSGSTGTPDIQIPSQKDGTTKTATEPAGAGQSTSAPSRKYAGFWKRFFAVLIDSFVLFFTVMLLAVFLTAGGNPDDVEAIGNCMGVVIGWLYFASMESSNSQATVGKMALGIKVTDSEGQRVSFGQATGRHFAKILSGLILGIGYLMAAFTEKKQALHDMMADCLVVNG